MQKTKNVLVMLGAIFIISACSLNGIKDETVKPVEKAANYVPEMVDINKKARENINDAVNKENQKLNDALGQGEEKTNQDNQKNNSMELAKKYQFAILKTNLGEIKVRLDVANAPKTAENFLKLANEKFYDGTKFHRVIKGFMIQGGDPLSKDAALKDQWGTGGPGYKFADELKGTEKYVQGTLAMANSGPDTNGSQFFIVTAGPAAPLPPSYTVFGSVVSGLEVALKIENVKTGQNDRPIEDVVIQSVTALEK